MRLVLSLLVPTIPLAPLRARRAQPLQLARDSYTDRWRERRSKDLLAQRELHVDDINSLFAIEGPDRLRSVLSPNEPFGAIFMLDALTNIAALRHEAWSRLAEANALRLPTRTESALAGEESVVISIQRVFRWTRDVLEARRLAEEYAGFERDVR